MLKQNSSILRKQVIRGKGAWSGCGSQWRPPARARSNGEAQTSIYTVGGEVHMRWVRFSIASTCWGSLSRSGCTIENSWSWVQAQAVAGHPGNGSSQYQHSADAAMARSLQPQPR